MLCYVHYLCNRESANPFISVLTGSRFLPTTITILARYEYNLIPSELSWLRICPFVSCSHNYKQHTRHLRLAIACSLLLSDRCILTCVQFLVKACFQNTIFVLLIFWEDLITYYFFFISFYSASLIINCFAILGLVYVDRELWNLCDSFIPCFVSKIIFKKGNKKLLKDRDDFTDWQGADE